MILLLNVNHLGHVDVAVLGDRHRVDGLALRVHLDEMQRLLGRTTNRCRISCKDLHSLFFICYYLKIYLIVSIIKKETSLPIVVMIAYKQTSLRVDAALERVLEHAGLVAIARSVDARELELSTLVHDRIAHNAMIGRVAHEQRVAVRGHTLGRC